MAGGWDGRATAASILGHRDPLSLVYTCGEKRVSSGDNLPLTAYPKNSLEIKEKESLIPGEELIGKIKPWISEKVRQERAVYFGGGGTVSLHERPAFSHMRL